MELSDQREQQIELDKLSNFYRQIPVIMFLAPTGGIILIWLQSDFVAPVVWLTWFVSVLLVHGLFSGFIWMRYRKLGRYSENVAYLHRNLIVFAVITSCVWGSIGIIFFPAESREHQMITIVWLWALAAMISASTVTIKQVFHIAIVMMMLPLAVHSALLADSFHILMSAATFAFTCGLILIYHYNHNTFIEAVALRYKNLDLVEELQIKNQQITQANRAKSRFLAAASHDLRQPVHAQGLYIAELDDHVSSRPGRRILAGLESSIDALRNLLDAVLDIARLDADVVTLNRGSVAIASIFDDLRSEFMPQFVDKNIAFRIINSSLYLDTDRTLLTQVLRNLLANALRYTHHGRVILGVRRHKKYCSIEVWDTGIGIDEDQKQSIFEEFYQVGNPERHRESGLGLGLAIVRRTCQLLGCEISLESRRHHGSVFRVSIEHGVEDTSTPAMIHDEVLAHQNLNDINVLLIEDEEQVRKAMQGLLASWGCNMLAASSTGEVVNALNARGFEPDIIIADYRLGNNETGCVAIESIRSELRRIIPAIIVTGDTDPERIKDAFNKGYVVLHKPVAPDLLRLNIATSSRRQ